MELNKLKRRVGLNQQSANQSQTEDNLKAPHEMDNLSQIFQAPINPTEKNEFQGQTMDMETNISVENIIPSKHNKFKPYEGKKQQDMIDSIKEQGIITPLTLRKLPTPGIYEIISGENRWRCAKLAGLTHVPANVVECDEDTAIMMLNDANLVCRDITLYERLQAFSQQYEVMKRRSGERSDLTEDGQKIDSMDMLAKKHGMSKTQMHRLIRISSLSEKLVGLIESKRVSADAGAKLLPLSVQSQKVLCEYLSDSGHFVNAQKAEDIISLNGELSAETLEDVFTPKEKPIKPVKAIKIKPFERFFSNVTDENEITAIIEAALTQYFEQQHTEHEEYSQIGEIE